MVEKVTINSMGKKVKIFLMEEQVMIASKEEIMVVISICSAPVMVTM